MESQNLEFKLDEPTFSPNDASFLRDLNGLIPGESSAPSYIPSKFEEQVRLVGSKLYVYNPKTQAWLSFTGASPGWQFVSYNTASAASITISGLDLGTDLTYKIIIHQRHATTGTIIKVIANNDTTANAHAWILSEAYDVGGGLSQNPDSGIGGGINFWTLGQGLPMQTCEMLLSYNSNSPMATWVHGGTDFSSKMGTSTGTGYYSGANITSLNITRTDANSASWAVWVFKSSQS